MKNPLYLRPPVFKDFPELLAAESTRHGGVSPRPYHSLNVGIFTDDDPENIRKNREILFHSLGISGEKVASSHQVHGDRILTAEKAGWYEGYDALITSRPGLYLSVTIADCTPILVYDPGHRAVAAIHAGWRGTADKIVQKTLLAMQQTFHTKGGDCIAYVGTCIDECSYEVGAEVAGHFETAFTRFDRERDKYFLDLKAANAAQLRAAGIPANRIGISAYSTVLDNRDYFSHRNEKGQTGRMLALIGLRP